ncbi:MAG: Protein GrpE [Gammaproteobacteria bacterium]|nr:MAG: Protein GrpE [Gammaproteobacteria bacterium]
MSSVDDKNQDNEDKSKDQVDETQSNADKPEKELSELELAQKQADDNYELLLRAKAEVENIKKRTSKEVENAFKYSTESLLQEIIPIYDSLSLSCELSGDKTTKEQLDEGNKLLLSMFKQLFEKNNIQEINPKNEVFNPELHQAVSTIEDKKKKNDIVAEVVQKGYLLNNRAIKPALVIVVKNS